MASSSGLCRIPSRSNSPLSIFRAKSVMYSAFRKVMPKLCSFSTPAPRMAAASTTPNSSRIRFQMVACAFVEICWPTMWCTTAEKRSVSTSLSMCPACAMTAAIRSSLALRYAVSASPYWKYTPAPPLLHNFYFCTSYSIILWVTHQFFNTHLLFYPLSFIFIKHIHSTIFASCVS